MLQKSLWFNALQKYMRQHTVLLKEDQNSFTLLGLRSEIAFYPLKAFNVFHHKVVVFIMCGRPDRDSFSFFFSFSLFPPKPKYLFWRHQRVVVLSCELSFPGVCCQGVWRGKYLPVLWWLSNHACIRPQLEAGCLYSSGCNADIYMLRSFKKQYAAEHLKTTYIYIFFPNWKASWGNYFWLDVSQLSVCAVVLVYGLSQKHSSHWELCDLKPGEQWLYDQNARSMDYF